LPAQHAPMAKLLLILMVTGAIASSLASAHSPPPLLIDGPHSTAASPAP
jgi:hypothetical protein